MKRNEMMAMLLAGGQGSRLGILTMDKAKPAVAFGGKYRIIDFPMSNCVNSGVDTVGVLTQYQPLTLNAHIGIGVPWDLDRVNGGVSILAPHMREGEIGSWYSGTANAIYQNIDYIDSCNPEYVLILSGDHIYKMDYSEVLQYHIDKAADLTIVYKNVSRTNKDVHDYGVMTFGENNKLETFEEKPIDAKSSNISLGIYVIKRTLLIKLLENAIPKGYYDFVKDIILRNKDKIDIYGYEFDGYWNTLNSVNSYMETNMDFLNKDVRKILTQEPFIASKPSDDPPAKYNPTAEVTNTLVGTGSIIDGNVKNSVLFRKVFVGEGATVENSVIMKSSYIGKGCVIKNAIIDKEVVISDNKEVIGTEEEPIVIGKGQVI